MDIASYWTEQIQNKTVWRGLTSNLVSSKQLMFGDLFDFSFFLSFSYLIFLTCSIDMNINWEYIFYNLKAQYVSFRR